MIQAQVVADSLNEFGNRLTTLLITFPRYILAELNTHRVLSKNSASSRAIPFKKMVESVEKNPFIPYAWQEDHKGMQGTVYLDSKPASYLHETLRDDIKAKDILDGIWGKVGGFERSEGSALYHAIRCAEELNMHKATKQLANRLLEPFMWHTVLISGTEWENFFELRCPQYNTGMLGIHRSWKDLVKAEREAYSNANNYAYSLEDSVLTRLKVNKGKADIHMMFLAEAIWDAINESQPKQLKSGDWHIPYEDKINLDEIAYLLSEPDIIGSRIHNKDRYIPELIKIATGMAARVSYTVIGDEGNLTPEDLKNGMMLEIKRGFTDGTVKTQQEYYEAPWERFKFSEPNRPYIERALTGRNAENGISGVRKALNYDTLIGIHDKMVNADPFHASPFEHCAQAMSDVDLDINFRSEFGKVEEGWCRNFKGFIQYRALLENGEKL